MIIRIEILIGLVKYSYQSMVMSMYMNHSIGPDTLIHHEWDAPSSYRISNKFSGWLSTYLKVSN